MYCIVVVKSLLWYVFVFWNRFNMFYKVSSFILTLKVKNVVVFILSNMNNYISGYDPLIRLLADVKSDGFCS